MRLAKIDVTHKLMLRTVLAQPDEIAAHLTAVKMMREIGEEYLAVGSKFIKGANTIQPMVEELEDGK